MTRRRLRSSEEKAEAKAMANSKRRLRRLWVTELELPEIADEMGVTEAEVLELAESLGLGERPEATVYIPTPQEIAEECAKIRETWSPQERETRIVSWWRYGRILEETTSARRGQAHHRALGGTSGNDQGRQGH